MYETQVENKWISIHEGNHEPLVNFFICIDALVAKFKSKRGVVKKDSHIISLVGLRLNGDIYNQLISYVSAHEEIVNQSGIVLSLN